MKKIYGLYKIQEIKDKFFDRESYQKIIKQNGDKEPYGVIYKITNLVNKKVYIGQSTKINNRIMTYIRNSITENTANRVAVESDMKNNIKNFKIEIIDFANSMDELDKKEFAYISSLINSTPELCYNDTLASRKFKMSKELSKKLSESHKGMKMSNLCKQKKSKPVVLIDLKYKIITICDGGKLAGDYLGLSKDLIKNYIKQSALLKERYLLIHLFKDDRKKHLENLEERYNNAVHKQYYQTTHLEKLNNLKTFNEILDKIFDNESLECLNFIDYKINRLSYSDDDKKPYILFEVDSFEELHNSLYLF